eukprot:Gregarina_sp_Poly_1__9713@NODE_617_length_7122_cov_220_571368_g473_i0_p4_GENE_NODE_617_length_7122_cov_220_571368_g473_i0NODE_617_length_7122_cov_220_571368_g473_i0_p4_ORF_typecomplete_len171_score34_58DUF2052/PF09747_9/0_96_NODE_617_length_7122_cov_220_571368_g473_i024062918
MRLLYFLVALSIAANLSQADPESTTHNDVTAENAREQEPETLEEAIPEEVRADIEAAVQYAQLEGDTELKDFYSVDDDSTTADLEESTESEKAEETTAAPALTSSAPAAILPAPSSEMPGTTEISHLNRSATNSPKSQDSSDSVLQQAVAEDMFVISGTILIIASVFCVL